jgi:hypothetical protein
MPGSGIMSVSSDCAHAQYPTIVFSPRHLVKIIFLVSANEPAVRR